MQYGVHTGLTNRLRRQASVKKILSSSLPANEIIICRGVLSGRTNRNVLPPDGRKELRGIKKAKGMVTW